MQRRTKLTRKAIFSVAALSTAALALTACGGNAAPGGGASSSTGGGGGTVAVTLITKTDTNPYFIAMQKGAQEAASKNGVKLTLAAGAKDGDTDGQVKAIEAAVTRQDKGILITPNGPGVYSAIDSARQAGLYVIALDTVPDPADTVDITFATDNFQAGNLIGKWAAAQLDGKDAVIALLDLSNTQVIPVDYNRDQGFLTGMGIPTGDVKKNGDEAKTGSYTGGKGGNYTIVCNEPTDGATDGGRTAMENCINKNKSINLVYTINEPAASGASEALDAAGIKATIVSVDGGCNPGLTLVKSGVIGATSQQYPLKMAQLGVEAIKKLADTGEKPAVTQGKDFYDTGVALVTDKTVSGLDSISVTDGQKICWG